MLLIWQIQKRKKKSKYLSSKIELFLQSNVFFQIPILTPFDKIFITKFIGPKLLQEHALFFIQELY